MTTQALQKVDHSAIKVSHITVICLNILAFIFNLRILTVVVVVFQSIGSALKLPAFGFIYQYALKPWGWVKPDVQDDNPEPHRFAQIVGLLFEAGGSLALYAGAPVLGWALIWIMVVLPALTTFVGFCVGCAVYYWLGKVNVPGFSKQPPVGTFPGMKPKAGGSNGS